MANSPQAEKRDRQALARRAHNVVHKTRFRTHQKRVVTAVAHGDKDAAKEALKSFVSVVDTTARKGIIHANKAARLKKRLNAAVVAMPDTKAS